MKRRSFILLTGSGILGATVPVVYRWMNLSDWGSPYAQPRLLSLVTTRRNIKSLGKQYVQLFPQESNYNLLFNLLSDSKQGSKRITHESNVNAILSIMDRKIKADFYNDRTLVLNGWVLSVTEARQCALFFLLNT
jgi:hypothetical protein